MRTFILLLFAFPFLATSQTNTSEDLLAAGKKKYQFEQGSINYVISGDASGTENFTFDRFGWRSLKKRTMKFTLYDVERSQVLHEVSDGELIYRINHMDSTFIQKVDMKWSSQSPNITPQQASEDILFALGGNYHSDSTLSGNTCQVWTFQNKSLKQMWIWKGLVVKRISMLGELRVVTTAESMKLDVSIDESIFELPADYEKKE